MKFCVQNFFGNQITLIASISMLVAQNYHLRMIVFGVKPCTVIPEVAKQLWKLRFVETISSYVLSCDCEFEILIIFFSRFSSVKQPKSGDKTSHPNNSHHHRVTFNDKNEVASQDMDGTFTVTYSTLGEKINQKCSSEHLHKRPGGLKVQFGETSCVETAVLPVITNDQSLYKDIYVTGQMMVTR